ncbi:hypothetical protein FHG89_32490, partial [Micromonospora orduensis]
MRTLPTPCARDGKGPGHQHGLPDLIEPSGSTHGLLPTTAGQTAHTGHHAPTRTDATRLLPTPRASDTGTPGRRAGAGFRPPLSQVLLPTPRATDGEKGCPGQRGSHGDLTLPSAAGRVPARTLP